MTPRTGRPIIGGKKDYMLRVRLDEDTVQELDECCKFEKLKRSELVRKVIKEHYEKITKK